MSHLDEVKVRTAAAIATGSIARMNEWLIALSDDELLAREERYAQQQLLRNAIVHHARQHKEEVARQNAERQDRLTRGGSIL